jgi:aspartyl/asparaginyl beta-hydroxylase (cupin superfamily)
MQLSTSDQQALIQQGAEALRQGRFAYARERLEKVAAAGSTNGIAWMLLALSRRAVEDAEGEEEAINRLLEIEPQSVRGHVMKGDCRASVGDDVNACYHYRTAVRLSEGRQLPEETAAEVGRGAQVLAELEAKAHSQKEAKLSSRGLPEHSWSPRFQHALELAAGKRKLYLQQPTFFNYPGLPHVQFYDPADFAWVPEVQAAAGAIRQELIELLKDGTDDFRAYLHGGAEGVLRMDRNKELVGKKDWSALFLSENGWVVPKVVERCPRTWETVLKAPVPRISGWGPTVMFSLLKAGARISPHTGMFNTRLICHLPLIVPPNCRFRVGNEVREWEEGKLLIFDDTIEHEAWNDSEEDRVVLIFDIWRPELSDQEKHELTTLFSD